MTKYLISFPSTAMVCPKEELPTVSEDARKVVREAKRAGIWVFGGGINEDVAPVRVAGDGTVISGTYPPTSKIEGGYAILELPAREAALWWAAKFATACRCAQEVREFQYDPES